LRNRNRQSENGSASSFSRQSCASESMPFLLQTEHFGRPAHAVFPRQFTRCRPDRRRNPRSARAPTPPALQPPRTPSSSALELRIRLLSWRPPSLRWAIRPTLPIQISPSHAPLSKAHEAPVGFYNSSFHGICASWIPELKAHGLRKRVDQSK